MAKSQEYSLFRINNTTIIIIGLHCSLAVCKMKNICVQCIYLSAYGFAAFICNAQQIKLIAFDKSSKFLFLHFLWCFCWYVYSNFGVFPALNGHWMMHHAKHINFHLCSLYKHLLNEKMCFFRFRSVRTLTESLFYWELNVLSLFTIN